ncbi:MAG: sulfatase [Anaerohalosphaera sp.]|nr:sulfatase [Anaerohalosphaera sp.]
MDRRAFLRVTMAYTASLTVAPRLPIFAASTRPKKRPNVLFLAVDDWNDWVGGMGHNMAKTPNLDRLAKRGVLFTNAHCAAPVCNPSRSAVLTGLRPSTTGIYNNGQPSLGNYPEVVTLPGYFRSNGYYTEGGGKITHEAVGFAYPRDWDYYYLWDEKQRANGWWGAYSWPPVPQPDPRPAQRITKHTKRNFDWAALDVPEIDWPDHKVATWAENFLAKNHNDPFFLAVGIFRPHIPWFTNKKYFDMYPLDEIRTPPYKKDDRDDLPPIAKKWAVDSASKHHLVQEYGLWKQAVQAYLACISFSDAQIGRVIDALDKSPYADDTIIVLWSDHGYHLGEKDHWHKQTLWERSTRVPFMVIAPGLTKPGSTCAQPVSLMDIYPTLVELCGLLPKSNLEGNSIVPLLKDPDKSWPYPAITTRDRGNHAIRTLNWRYIRYSDGTEELYDHRSDPNEWNNLAGETKYKKLKTKLACMLPKQNAEPALNYKTKEIIFDPKTYTWTKAIKKK